MKSSIILVAAAFLCLIAFPATTVGKNLRFWSKPTERWPHPSEASPNEMFMSTASNKLFNYGDSKVWKCTHSNGSGPAISISTPSPSTPSTPSPTRSTPKTSMPPPTPSPPPPTPKKVPSPSPPPSPSLPPPTPKKTPSPLPPTPSPPPPTPMKAPSPPPPTPSPSPSPPTPKIAPSPPLPSPSPPPPTPKKSPSPPPQAPSLPPPTPKKSPSPSPPNDDESSSPSQPSNPPPEHHHHHEYPSEHIGRCYSNMGRVGFCRGEMAYSFYTRLFKVSKYCCNLIVNMKNECDDVIWGYFHDPLFVPLVRCTCHVTF